MAWLSRVNFTASDVLSYTDLNNIGNDIRAWGGNVNGGGYTLSNVVLSASSGTMATVIGGTGTTSALTLRSTSGVGTTGADIIFQAGNNGATEVMRLQNGGNVGIGTASPGVALDVQRSSADVQIRAYTGTADLRFWAYHAGAGVVGTSSAHPLIFATNGLSERMRIDSSGNVGIGTSSPAALLHVASGTTTSTNLARIYAGSLASGNAVDMFIGKAASSNQSAAFGFNYNSTSTSSYAYVTIYGDSTTTGITVTPGGKVGIGKQQSTYSLEISADSAAKPTTNTWTIASDSRLKTVKGEYQKGLAEICQVRPVSYEYNGKAGFVPDGKDKVSILAQELMQVFPECVDTFKGKLEEDGPEIDLYNYNGHAITFALINAIKELKAEIDILKARN